jgi:cytochrome c oxidase assembly factor CtaG
MSGRELFTSGWEFHPSVVAGCLLLLAAYLVAVRFRVNRITFFFGSGVMVMFLALVSPLDSLGDDYLFSAHMAQHILVDMVVPPLFVLGIPAGMAAAMLRFPPAAWAERILGKPVVAWTLGIATLWIWHLPYLYNATLENKGIHIFEHLTFLVTGTIFWWPVFSPLPERRMTPLGSMIYLSLGAIANALLGIIFTISATPFYSGYANPKDELGALSLIRDTWGLSQIADQQLGGAFMWAFGSVIFFWAIMVMVARWLRETETQTEG